jgi:hypothetical protein
MGQSLGGGPAAHQGETEGSRSTVNAVQERRNR